MHLDRVARFRWPIVLGWLAVVAALSAIWASDGDWNWFRTGSRALLGDPVPGMEGGVHLYASSPRTQIGPPGLVAATAFTWLPQPWDLWVARLAMSLALVAMLWLVDRLAEAHGVDERARRRGTLLGGLVLVPSWVDVAVEFAHLDDVLVLLLVVAAMALLVRGRPTWAAVAIGLALATKPWAVVAAPVLLRGGWRGALRPGALAAAVAAACWLPFLADPDTLGQLWQFRLQVQPQSALAVLGVEAGGPVPGWVRPVQMVGGLALGALAARRGHWTGVLLVGLAVRVALDPNPLLYYTVGPVVGALVWDMTRTRTGIPWTAGTAMAAISLAPFADDDRVLGVLRLLICAGLVLAVLVRRRASRAPAGGSHGAGEAAPQQPGADQEQHRGEAHQDAQLRQDLAEAAPVPLDVGERLGGPRVGREQRDGA